MPSRTILVLNFFDITSYPANQTPQDGWTPGANWDANAQDVTIANPRTPGTTIRSEENMIRTNWISIFRDIVPITGASAAHYYWPADSFFPGSSPSDFTVEFIWSMGISTDEEPNGGYQNGQIELYLLDPYNALFDKQIEFRISIEHMFDWHSATPTYIEPNIVIDVLLDSVALVPSRYIRQPTSGTPIMELPVNAGDVAWNGIRVRFLYANVPLVYIDKGLRGSWVEAVPDSVVSLGAPPSGDYFEVARFQLYGTDGTVVETGVDNFKLITQIDYNEVPSIGMYDEEGNIVIGIDPNDDGSGVISQGSNGLGGGGDGGIASGGTGLVGSGSEGNVADDQDQFPENTGGASAWRGSGTGIDILRWNFTSLMDGFGFAEVHLSMVDSWNKALTSYLNRMMIMVDSFGLGLFRGYVRDIKEEGRYRAKLVIEHIFAVIQRRETQKNFAVVINRNGEIYDTISALTTTTITLKNGQFPSSLTTGSEFAVLIVPASEPSFSNEDYDLLVTGSGNIDNVNSDTGWPNPIELINAQNGEFVEIQGTYSGTRTEVEAIGLYFKVVVNELVWYETIIHIDIYNYNSAAWEEDILNSLVEPGGLGFSVSGNLEFEGTPIVNNATNYIESGTNFFKTRVRVTFASADFSHIRVQFADVKMYTDPSYDFSHFPITGKSGAVLTVSVDPVAANVNIGDRVVVGKRDDLVLADLAGEFFLGYEVDVDAGFTNYTSAQFANNNMTNYDAIISVLKKNQGIFYYRDSLNTVFFKKRANLDTTSDILSDDPSDPIQVEFLDNAKKVGDQYQSIQVTGAKYKTYDGEAIVYGFSERLGGMTNRVLRINDPTILSRTEAQNRVDSELALLDQAKQPTHSLNVPWSIIADNTGTGMAGFYPGRLFQVKRKGFTYANVPLRMMNVSSEGGRLIVNLELGWKGTTPIDQEINKQNELITQIRQSYKAMKTRPIGQLGGNEITSHDHIGLTNIQETETITSTGAGTTVASSHKTHAKYGLLVTPNDNTGTFTSATIKVEVSFDGESTWHKILEVTLDTAAAYSDFTNIDNLHTIASDNDWSYASGTDLLTDDIDIRYNITELTLVGNADVDIILLKSR